MPEGHAYTCEYSKGKRKGGDRNATGIIKSSGSLPSPAPAASKMRSGTSYPDKAKGQNFKIPGNRRIVEPGKDAPGSETSYPNKTKGSHFKLSSRKFGVEGVSSGGKGNYIVRGV